jgi:monothiol glutaredoxin
MSRPARSEAAAAFLDGYHADTVAKVRDAVASEPIVVVGMGWNPHVARVRKALTAAGVAHHYVELGNYSNMWRERLAVKLWSGWPTFPQVFVRGELLGGDKLTRAAIDDGTLRARLDQPKIEG